MSLRFRLSALLLAVVLVAVVAATLLANVALQQQAAEEASVSAQQRLVGATTLAYNSLQTELSREQAAAKYLSVSQPVMDAVGRQAPGAVQDDVLEPYRRTSSLSFISLISTSYQQIAQAKTPSPPDVTSLSVLQISLRLQYDAVAFWDGPGDTTYAVAAAPVFTNNVLIGAVVVGRALNSSYMSDLTSKLGDFQAMLMRGNALQAAPMPLEQKLFGDAATSYPVRPLAASLPPFALPSTVWHVGAWQLGPAPYLAVTRPLDYGSTTELAVALPLTGALTPRQPLLTPVAAELAQWLHLPSSTAFSIATHLAWWLALFALLVVLGGAGLFAVRRALRPLGRLTGRLERFRATGDWAADGVVPGGDLGRLTAAAAALAGDASRWSAELRTYQGRLQAVLDSMGTGVVVSDPAGRVELINPAARELLGLDVASAALPAAVTGGQDSERRIQASNGRVLNAVSTPIRRPEGETVGLVTVLDDVTREHELERVRTDFLSVVSHELRTPLTTIKGSLDLLVDGEAGELDLVQQRFLVTARRNTERLIVLVNDLLDLSRIEAGQVRLALNPVDLRRVVDDAVIGLGTLFDRKGQAVHLELPEQPLLVQADRRRIEQIIVNLLSNAASYTPEAGEVWIMARAERERNAGLITVRNSGPGIAPEDREHLFEKFYRGGDALTRPDGGSGLGLAIVKSLVELHHGTITVESTPGEGAAFVVRVPLAGIA